MTEYIYALICPIENKVKYVGKTKDPKKRYNQHLKKLDAQMTPKRKWLENIFAKGLKPKIQILEKCENNGREREQFYVTKYKTTTLNIHNPEKGAKSNDWKPCQNTTPPY
jgi:predicted GIY-YIG superfamily endonuclease